MSHSIAADLGPKALADLLRSHPLFAALPDVALAAVADRGTTVRFGAGEVIVRQGDASDAAFLLLDGLSEVVVESRFGPVPLVTLEGGAIVGELGALAGLARSATVRSRSPVTALRIAREDMIQLGRDNPELLLSVIAQLGQRIGTVDRALGYYTHALAALERHDFDPAILDALRDPVPELVDFAQSFRRAADQIVQRRLQHDEMASAATIQRAMLPASLAPDVNGDLAVIHAEIRPAREIGGDFYDYFPVGGDRLGIVIADVSGKGIPAALFMAMTRTVTRLVAREEADPALAMRRANELLSADNPSSMFATLFYGVFDPASGALIYCNCGHNPPLVIRRSGACEPLHRTGIPLGLFADAAYETRRTDLDPDDALLLYTDGVTEANSLAGEEFGEERLAAAIGELHGRSGAEFIQGILARIDEFAQDTPQFDDLTLLTLSYNGSLGIVTPPQ